MEDCHLAVVLIRLCYLLPTYPRIYQQGHASIPASQVDYLMTRREEKKLKAKI